MDEHLLDRLDRKVDLLLDRTKNVENDHQEIIKLRDRMHKVEGAQNVFGRLLEQYEDLHSGVGGLDERVEQLENNQLTSAAVKKALEDHQRASERRTEKREKRIFAILGVLTSGMAVNLLMNIMQAPTPNP